MNVPPVTDPPTASLTQMREAFLPGAAGYLNTASYGLPPPATIEAMRRAVDEWAAGVMSPPDVDPVIRAARASFARITGVPEDTVAIAGQVSSLVGLLAAWVPAGGEVLAVEGEFTSVIFPFLARPELQVRLVPPSRLVAEISERTRLVAVSVVQSADGTIADLPALRAAASHHGSRLLLDGTQAAGWLPYDATLADVHVVGAYKWLLSPRGTAFASVAPSLWEELPALHANWYAGEDPWRSIYGGPLRLAASARRFDLSPAWLPWTGTAHSLAFVEAAGIPAIHAHDVRLASLARTALGLPPSGSAIVSLPLPDDAAARLSRAGVRYAVRDGRARFSFHVYTSEDDVDRLTDCLTR